jgi:hypothetical protein
LVENRGWEEFMETTAFNVGVRFKNFYDFDEAMGWLNG